MQHIWIKTCNVENPNFIEKDFGEASTNKFKKKTQNKNENNVLRIFYIFQFFKKNQFN